MSPFVAAVEAASLEPGLPVAVEIEGAPVCVVRVDAGVFAFDDVCPHRGAALSEGKLTGTTLMCAAHTWEFDVTTGELLRLRAPACLSMRETREVDGQIEISTEVIAGTPRPARPAPAGGRI